MPLSSKDSGAFFPNLVDAPSREEVSLSEIRDHCNGPVRPSTSPKTPISLVTLPLSAVIPSAIRGPGQYLPGSSRRYHRGVAKPSLVDHGISLVKHVVPALMRPIRSLWNEVIGFIFLSFAFLGLVRGYREVRAYDGEPRDVFGLILIGFFVAIMGGFGISSFLRARKISRS